LPEKHTNELDPKYRPDIDGLRAIAVLSVLGFHAFPKVVPGGFIGVDIFFVISGFLISSILFENLERDRFSIVGFYNRRIRRIFPALITVMVVSLAFGWYVLLADEYSQLGKHIAAGAAFISNFAFYSESGYFDNAAETKPMLHLWSLAIEEQFYIFWPPMLAIVWKRKWSFLRITAVIAVLSFAADLYLILVSNDRTAAFYWPVSRFWELMIGGILAYVTMHRQEVISKYKGIQSAIGFALLAISLVLINKYKPYPSWWTLPPTVGCFFVISAGSKAWLNKNVLSVKPLVSIGLVSYPLYLWHWPILAYARIIEGAIPSRVITCGALAASFALAYLTYWYIEKPIRFGRKTYHAAATLLCTLTLVLIIGVLSFSSFLKPRIYSRDLQSLAVAAQDREYFRFFKEFRSPNGVYALILQGSNGHSTIFVGDSHVDQYGPRVARASKEMNKPTNTAIFVTDGGCPPIPNVFDDAPVHSQCEKTRNYGFDLIKNDRPNTVVIGACWNCYFINEADPGNTEDDYKYYTLKQGKKHFFKNGDGVELALENLESLIRSIDKQQKVYLLLDNPRDQQFDPRSHFSGSRFTKFTVDSKNDGRVSIDEKQIALRSQLIQIAKRQGIDFLDPSSMNCVEDQCPIFFGKGEPVYRDSNHFRAFFVRANATFIDQVLVAH
jgi:peptidoglycan/LPS O-acetylase OafA/YrhL